MQWSPHRSSQRLRQFVRLIESPPKVPPWVQRHRHHGIRACEQPAVRLFHQGSKRRSQGSVPAVFQRVHDLTQRTVIKAKGPGKIELRRMGHASRALAIDSAAAMRRFSASVTPRRSDATHRTPATKADGTHSPRTDRSTARGARRVEKRLEDRIRPSNNCHEWRWSKNPATTQATLVGGRRGPRPRTLQDLRSWNPFRAQKLRSVRRLPRGAPVHRTFVVSGGRRGR